MTSLIATIRGIVSPGSHPLALDEGEPDANASLSEAPLTPEASTTGGDMSVNQTVPGAASATGATAAVVPAVQGGADGVQAAMTRINAILSADGIKGDGTRMSAALELASTAPGMTAEQVVAFVTGNVAGANTAAPAAASASAPAAAAPAGQPAISYEQQRLAAANLAMPGGGQPAAKETVGASWKDAIAKAGVGRKGA